MTSQSTETPQTSHGINIPEMTVSALSQSLQRTLEDAFGRVRVRGEIAGLKIAASGHLYADLKDENANINIICWRGTVSRLKIRPEDGMDVICTGKITTYPKSSRYQMIVDSIELAGEGALLKMLEDRRKKLAAEGLFDESRKKPLPRIPRRIGIITSPTGAVIQDILHRLRDRFPRPVVIWPVAVQGDSAAEQVTAAIQGFNAMTGADRPDLIIVARGGGSLEDLMAFNDENLVRAAAESRIPLISAVGHETDTTLIDYAADRRAPTPTAAAEMAVPVRLELLQGVLQTGLRLHALITQKITLMQERIKTARAHLGDPARLINVKAQQLDFITHRLSGSVQKTLTTRRALFQERAASLRHPRQIIAEKARLIALWSQRLSDLTPRLLTPPRNRLERGAGLLEAFSFHNVLKRGFAVVRDAKGAPVSSAQKATTGPISVQFHDGTRTGSLE